MKKYFRLHPHVRLVDGTKKCAIYNIFKGEVFSISKDKYQVLCDCEKNIPLSEIVNVDYDFISNLIDNGLGLTYDDKVFVNKDIYGYPQSISNIFKQVSLNRLFVEVTNKCNLNCKFCNEDNILFRKTGCKKWSAESDEISLGKWKDIIEEAKGLGCKNFVITGGEPFLEFEKLKEITSYIHNDNFKDNNIVVFTNATLFDDEKLSYIKQNNMSLCIQILASDNYKYTEISGDTEAFSNVINSVNKIKDNNISYILLLLISRFNENQVEEIIKKFKGSNIKLEFIYPINNEFYSKKYLNLMYNKSKDFIKPSLLSFDKYSKYNNCYKNTLAVSCDGLIYPCIMSRKLCLGSIKDISLYEALIESENKEYPTLCRDKIDDCKTCHKRYGCLDCRALEISATNNIYGMEFCDLIKGNSNE